MTIITITITIIIIIIIIITKYQYTPRRVLAIGPQGAEIINQSLITNPRLLILNY